MRTDSPYPVNKDKYGYIDKAGKMVIQPMFGASRFSEGLAAVQLRQGEKVGYIDEAGKPGRSRAQFDLADPFSEGLAAVMRDHQWGYIDKTGKMVIPTTFGLARPFSEGLAGVVVTHGTSGLYGYINPSGKFVIDPRYEAATPFGDGVAAVRAS